MSREELRENIKKELRWWKWLVGTVIILVVFFSNFIANKMYYETDLQNLKEDVQELKVKYKSDMQELTSLTKKLSHNIVLLCQFNGLEVQENPFE